jgi:alpha-glucosidase
VYIRSFADGNGDGTGDIQGIRSRLPYLRDLGVDAIWVTPWYRSPMADGGYDVADFRDIDPLFGSLSDAESLVQEAHDHGLRALVDIVPNHTSDQHPWFQAAISSPPGSAPRSRYWLRPGKGSRGQLPPNNWCSRFGGPAWERLREPDGSPGEWYLHLYTPEQPDLNWESQEVRADFESTLRFWLDRGVDGFRVDVAHGLAKHPDLPDLSPDVPDIGKVAGLAHPYRDLDAVHEIYQTWREISDSYDGERVFVAEAWVASPGRLANYVAKGRLHTAFNFDFLQAPWSAGALRSVIDETLGAHRPVGAPATWVLANHDVVRPVTRYGRAETAFADSWRLYGTEVDRDLGTRRARAAALLLLSLPGGAYIYQGDELGLAEVEDLPEEVRQDPSRLHSERCRDGCRVPLPWTATGPSFGFSTGSACPWLPQPAWWGQQSVEAQSANSASMLSLYRSALYLRRHNAALGDGDLLWDDYAKDVLSFRRPPDFRCIVNLSADVVPLPSGERVLLASAPVDDNQLPPDSAAWLVF